MSRPRIVASTCAVLFLLCVIAAAASGEIPRKINYQGRLVDAAGVPLAGGHNLTFRIFDAAVVGTALWAETQPVTADSAGVFAVTLGGVDSIGIAFDGPRWLEVEVDGEVLAPRREMVSAPFALQAGNSHLLEGLHPDAFADSAHGHSSLDASDGEPASAVFVDDEGSVGVGAETPGAKLDVAGTARMTGFKMPTGAAVGQVLTADAAGAGTWQAPQAMPDADWVVSGDNMHSAVAGNVGIGKVNPTHKLDVFESSGANGSVAVFGANLATSGRNACGVYGATSTLDPMYTGAGVQGVASGATGRSSGILGVADGAEATGVSSLVTHTTGSNKALYAETKSPNGYAGYFVGGRNYFEGRVCIGTIFPGAKLLVVESSSEPGATSVYGISTSSMAQGALGVGGSIASGDSVVECAGVYGVATNSSGNARGVLGRAAAASGIGVYGDATHSTGCNFGLWAHTSSPNGYAGYFTGGRNYLQGKVGIGTPDPQSRLHLNGEASETTRLQFTNAVTGSAGTDGTHLAITVDGSAYLANMENKALSLGANGASRIWIHPSGSISMGSVDTFGSVTMSYPNPILILNSTDPDFPNASIGFFSSGVFKGAISWSEISGSVSIGRAKRLYIDNAGRLGFDDAHPDNLLDVEGDGTANGGVNGYTEVVGHFTNTGEGHTAVSIDAEASLDPILYLAENGVAYWDLRTDSDNAQKLEMRYHGLGMRNDIHVVVDTLGRVGIGTTNPGSYKLYVAGTAYSTGGWSSSDARLKTKIAPIDDALSKSLALRGVSFEWRRDEFPDKGLPEGRHYGLVAQEVEEVLPEVVKEGPEGDKAVAYTEIVPVLVEALKAQQAEIEDLKLQVKELRSEAETRH